MGKKFFKVGTPVRVSTKRHGDHQYGDIGVVSEVSKGNPNWPYKVSFNRGSHFASNCYGHGDLALIPTAKKPKPVKAGDFRVVGEKPQTSLLLDHFTERKSISAVEAQALYRIRSLSRRINDLEIRGYAFRREHSVDPTGQRYVRYHFLGEELGG